MQYDLFHDSLHTRIKINGSSITTNNKKINGSTMVKIENEPESVIYSSTVLFLYLRFELITVCGITYHQI